MLSTHTNTHIPVGDVSSICCVFVTVSLCTWLLDQRNMLVFALIVRQLWKLYRLLKTSPLVQQWQCVLNDISTHHSVGFLGPWIFWIMWKCYCQWACKGGFHSSVCHARAGLGGLKVKYKEQDKMQACWPSLSAVTGSYQHSEICFWINLVL